MKHFKYLGITFTTQLSFSKHVEPFSARVRSTLGILSKRIDFKDLELKIVLQIILYLLYVLPAFLYGLPLWLSNCSKSSLDSIDSTFSKFLKQYLGIPIHANNAITYFLTGTRHMSNTLKFIAPNSLRGFSFQ